MSEELNLIVQDVEKTLVRHDVHLKTDDFNNLYDFISAIILRIRENGE